MNSDNFNNNEGYGEAEDVEEAKQDEQTNVTTPTFTFGGRSGFHPYHGSGFHHIPPPAPEQISHQWDNVEQTASPYGAFYQGPSRKRKGKKVTHREDYGTKDFAMNEATTFKLPKMPTSGHNTYDNDLYNQLINLVLNAKKDIKL